MSKSHDYNGKDRRRTKRRPILETFSLSVVIPKKGPVRLPIQDLSDLGIGCDWEATGEPDSPNVQVGEVLEVHLYLNQSLYLPLQMKIARILPKPGHPSERQIGAEFVEKDSPGINALKSFVKVIDSISSVAKIG